MTRFIIGAALLAMLLICGLWIQSRMTEIHQPIAREMMQASLAAQSGDRPSAARHAARAEEAWFRSRRFTASLADHQPLEDIESLMAQLPGLDKKEELPTYAAICAELSRRILAVAEAHKLQVGTFF